MLMISENIKVPLVTIKLFNKDCLNVFLLRSGIIKGIVIHGVSLSNLMTRANNYNGNNDG